MTPFKAPPGTQFLGNNSEKGCLHIAWLHLQRRTAVLESQVQHMLDLTWAFLTIGQTLNPKGPSWAFLKTGGPRTPDAQREYKEYLVKVVAEYKGPKTPTRLSVIGVFAARQGGSPRQRRLRLRNFNWITIIWVYSRKLIGFPQCRNLDEMP